MKVRFWHLGQFRIRAAAIGTVNGKFEIARLILHIASSMVCCPFKILSSFISATIKVYRIVNDQHQPLQLFGE